MRQSRSSLVIINECMNGNDFFSFPFLSFRFLFFSPLLFFRDACATPCPDATGGFLFLGDFEKSAAQSDASYLLVWRTLHFLALNRNRRQVSMQPSVASSTVPIAECKDVQIQNKFRGRHVQ